MMAVHQLVEQIINRRNNNALNSTFDLVIGVWFLYDPATVYRNVYKSVSVIRVEVNGELDELHRCNTLLMQASGCCDYYISAK